MRILTVLGILFYAAVIILAGIILVAFSLNLLQPQYINNLFDYLQSSPNSRIFTGLAGAILILVSFSFARIILGRLQREKNIAFDTASGEVTIALSAVEDLIRRLTGVIPEIKEILKKEANIPELTSRLQNITKSKIQEVLGVEDQITVKIHIAKIIALDEKDRNKKDIEKEEPAVPFRGYGRV